MPEQCKMWEGAELTRTIDVKLELTEAQYKWLMDNVADFGLGPTPEDLDEAGVLRELIHGQMQREFEVK